MQTSAAPAVKLDQVQLIPVEKIKPSPFNARKEFPKEYIAELGASLLRDGQQTPVKVRPVKDGFELVFGECRWRGATAAGVPQLKAIVEVMDDARAEHLCLIENIKRRDLTVFEEAEKLKRLHEVHKVKVDDLALQVGLAARTVRENLKLANVSQGVRDLVLGDQLTVSNAKLISRVSKSEQDSLAKRAAGVVKDQHGRRSDPMTHDELEKYIREQYMVDLRFAPFDVKQKGLPCVAPTCAECPKMSANAKEEFPDLKGSFCLSTPDYRKKLDAFMKVKAEELGAQILPAEKTVNFFNDWNDELRHDSGFKKAHEKHHEDEKNRSYKQLLGKDELAKRLFLVRTPKNELVEVLKADGLDAALKKEGRFKKRKGSIYSSPYAAPKESKAAKEKRLAKEAFEAKLKPALVGKIVEKVEAKGLTPALLKVMAASLLDNVEVEALDRRGLGGLNNKKAKEHIDKLKPEQLAGLVFEFCLAWNLYGWKNQTAEITKAVGVDEKKIEAEVKAAIAAEEARKAEFTKAAAKLPRAEPKKVKKAA